MTCAPSLRSTTERWTHKLEGSWMQPHQSVVPLEGKVGNRHRTAGDQTQSPAGHSAVLVEPELLVADSSLSCGNLLAMAALGALRLRLH